MPRAWSRGFTSRCISSATPETSCNIKMLVSCLHLFATVAASCQVYGEDTNLGVQLLACMCKEFRTCRLFCVCDYKVLEIQSDLQQMKPTRTMINFSDLMGSVAARSARRTRWRRKMARTVRQRGGQEDEAPGLADCSDDEYHNPHKKYRKGKAKTQSIWFVILKAQIETRTPYMFYKDRVLPFQWCQDIPGECIRFVYSDSRVFLFSNSKCKRYFHNHLKPGKLIWNAMYRKQHKNYIRVEAAKKRHRAIKSPYGLADHRLWTRH
ncbi:hypothetical protein CFC21_084037 [Triticum aestivum]|uniref:Large ribosomal subunit protein eL24-related N-terminal domain-containing protein n=3 Tax=Triticum TaxID=4564 RepID=A0A9R0Y4P9_TRITD|nr:hypothetical protein CFC21_084037 [Triticum aestivum]VAI48141.1 unnamed protein product [Triticum turgidum subsp. durum]